MLAIRLQRTGRSGHAQFRVIVQDSRFSPKRGRVVSYLGNYDPHTKTAVIDSDKAAKYMQNGARPSDRVARLFKNEGIKLPDWVKLDEPKKRSVRNPEKRRSTAPAQPEAPKEPPAAEEPAAETETDQQQEETATESAPKDEAPESPKEDTKEAASEETAPAEDTPAEHVDEKPEEKAAES